MTSIRSTMHFYDRFKERVGIPLTWIVEKELIACISHSFTDVHIQGKKVRGVTTFRGKPLTLVIAKKDDCAELVTCFPGDSEPD